MSDEAIEYLVGPSELTVSRQVPYAPTVCLFLEEWSKILRQDSQTALLPDVATFSFWCRPANMKRWAERFDGGRSRLGRGLVFHIAPSNVPVNFAFSLAFGLLAGNANLVRVPSHLFPQTDLLCRTLREALSDDRFESIRLGTSLVRYARESGWTERFSARCDARVIWGGDETIRQVRCLPIPPRAVEITFADRYSLCFIQTEAIAALSDAKLDRLAADFCGDAYLMGQGACSSPHLIVWLGDGDLAARRRFWNAVKRAAKKFPLPSVGVMDKFTRLCANAVAFDGLGAVERTDNSLYVVPLERLPERLDALRGQSGLFYEYVAGRFDDWAARVTDKFQTVTCFGLERKRVVDEILRRGLAGIDRVVPIGSALDIGPVWDGCDVIETLSRIVDY